MYEAMKFLHVAAAVVWIGGGTWSYLLVRRLQAAGPGALGPVQAQVSWFGKAVLTPVSVLALFTGMYLVLFGSFDPKEAWIAVGVAGILASIVVGMGVISPTGTKLGRLVAEHGPTHEAVPGLQRRVRAASVFNLVVLWLVLFAMVVRPGA